MLTRALHCVPIQPLAFKQEVIILYLGDSIQVIAYKLKQHGLLKLPSEFPHYTRFANPPAAAKELERDSFSGDLVTQID